MNCEVVIANIEIILHGIDFGAVRRADVSRYPSIRAHLATRDAVFGDKDPSLEVRAKVKVKLAHVEGDGLPTKKGPDPSAEVRYDETGARRGGGAVLADSVLDVGRWCREEHSLDPHVALRLVPDDADHAERSVKQHVGQMVCVKQDSPGGVHYAPVTPGSTTCCGPVKV